MIKTFEAKLVGAERRLAELSWGLLHIVLPREGRTEGLLTNLKGLSSNNIVRESLPLLTPESEHPVFFCRGLSNPTASKDGEKKAENSDEKEESFLSIDSHFHGFLNRKKIQYKTEVRHEGNLQDFLLKPVFEFNPEIKIEELFCGLEYFEPHLFWMIGMAPRLSKAIIIQTNAEKLIVKISSDLKNSQDEVLADLLQKTFNINLGN